MKAVVINQYGSKEVLEEAEVTLPELSEHQVLVKNTRHQLIRLIGNCVKDI